MTSQISLLRKESFGGTLSNAVTGRRIYVDKNEFLEIKKSRSIPAFLSTKLETSSLSVLIREPIEQPAYNFSAPDVVFFEITRACNLSCEHCFNSSGKRLPFELLDHQRNSVIEDFCTTGVQEVRFTGGEPLVVPAVFDYIEYIRSMGLRASIGTNGALITASVAKRLASAGLNVAITSIDGMENKHDLIRGQGSFCKTITGIKALQEVGIPVRVNTVAMKSNIEEIPRIVDYFFKQGIPLMIRRFIPSGRADEMKDEMLTSVDYDGLRSKLRVFLDDSKGLVKGHYLKDDKMEPRIKLPFERRSCSAGHRGLVVLPNGHVQTCGFLGPLGEKSVGDLKVESLSIVWQRLVESEHIESLRSLLPDYNAETVGPKTNCLAIALAGKNNLIQIKGVKS